MAVLVETARPTEGIRHEEPNTALFVGSNNVGTGTLYITESVVSWLVDGNRSISIPYPNIILHAVSRDLTRFEHECLYMHTDAELPGLSSPDTDDDEADEMDPSPKATELRFVPADKNSLSSIFNAMAECQALHPDPNDDLSEEEDDIDEFEDYDLEDAPRELANMHISTNGVNGDGGDSDPEMDQDNFEDAEEN